MPVPGAIVPLVAPATKGVSMGLAKFGIPIAGGLMQIPAVKEGMRSITQPGIDTAMDMYGKGQDARGYITGYDTKQTPFEVAKERGLAGVLGGTIDTITGGMTDFDKRGDSKKQKDVKKFLNKFIYGTGEQMRQANPAGAMPGFEFPDSKTYTPGKSQFGGFS